MWQTAQRRDTISAYVQFLARHPSGEIAQRAQDRLQTLRTVLQGLKTVRFVVHETYVAGPADEQIDGLHLPLSTAIAGLLTGVDVEVVVAPDAQADGELRLRVEGRALRKTYAPTDERALTTRGTLTLQYAGADLRGLIALRGPDELLYEHAFSGRATPPDQLGSERYPTPSDAPFAELFETTLLPVAARMVGDLYGAQSLLPVLRDGKPPNKRAAVTALGLLADSTATLALIEALSKTANFELKGAIIIALGRIGDDRATPMLIQALLKAFDISLREHAAEALGLIGAEAAIDALIESLVKDAPSVRLQVVRSLRRITGESFGDDADAWWGWWEISQGGR
jgi:hypothetical protein